MEEFELSKQKEIRWNLLEYDQNLECRWDILYKDCRTIFSPSMKLTPIFATTGDIIMR